MRIAQSKPLFAWDCLEDSPTLKTIRELLAAVPDGQLLESLRSARGKGRNDYPVHVLWGVVLLTILLRHRDTEACLAELKRNAGLARLIGIESETDVPSKWNMSRFEEALGSEPHRTHLKDIFVQMIARLGAAVPDLGQHTAGDATGLSARRSKSVKAQAEQDEGLPQAAGGRKEYLDEQGKVTHVVEWFGFKLHLLVDVQHEVALAYEITDTKAGDGETLPALVDQAQAVLPKGRLETLAYDKAADSNDVHRRLDRCGIKPLIEMRSLWEREPERRLPGHDGNSNIVYDEAGTLYCYDLMSRPIVRHPMAYIGHEPQRQTLKYRCPAQHEGWECPMSAICNAGKSYGLTVRVKRDIDLRRFPPIPRATKKFERLYKGRTAVERVNGRLKVFWGADDGNLTGSRRFHAKVGAVLIVHAAFAIYERRVVKPRGADFFQRGWSSSSPSASVDRSPSSIWAAEWGWALWSSSEPEVEGERPRTAGPVWDSPRVRNAHSHRTFLSRGQRDEQALNHLFEVVAGLSPLPGGASFSRRGTPQELDIQGRRLIHPDGDPARGPVPWRGARSTAWVVTFITRLGNSREKLLTRHAASGV